MPLIVKELDPTQGHCWPAVPMKASPGTEVYIDGQKAIVVGDTSILGTHGGTCGDTSDHPVIAAAGSPSVFVGGIPVVRDADPMGCGDLADTPFGTVYADGGGNISQIVAGVDPASAFETIGYFVRSITDSYNITLPGKIRVVRTGINPPRFRQEWRSWRPPAFDPKPSNGFRVTLEEEITGKQYTSYAGVGAPSLPAAAPEYNKEPLDPRVSYQVIEGPFSVDSNTGVLTMIPFIPPRSASNPDFFVTSIPVTVRINYDQGIIFKEIQFSVGLNLTTG